jgi:hypothetical protein
MEKEFRKSVFYRSFMTAVFVGIIATIVTMVYDLIFVRQFGFPYSTIINVSSLIFGVNIAFLIVGLVYYMFLSTFRKGDILYITLLIIVTAFLAWRSEHVQRSLDASINHQFRDLLAGVVVIMGAMAAFLVPFLYHNRKFEDLVL